MDIVRVRRDIEICLALKKQGAIRDMDWNLEGMDNWLAIYGAFKLPAGEFNFPDGNIKLPIPANLYDQKRDGKFQFYKDIYIDEKLRRIVKGREHHIERMIPNHDNREKGKGWSYLCIIPLDVGAETDIRSLLPIVQGWIINNGR